MKVIFLDFQGVMIVKYGQSAVLLEHQPGPLIEPRAIAALNEIIAATDAFVVVASTMRQEYMIGALKHYFEQHGLEKGRMIYQTEAHADSHRGREIDDFLEHHSEGRCASHRVVTSYAVLDDEIVVGHEHRQVRVSRNIGLDDMDAQDAIGILNQEVAA